MTALIRFPSPALITIACFLLAGESLARPEVRTVIGKVPGPSVRIEVGRAERAKAVGIDKQLAAFPLEKGRLEIVTYDGDVPPSRSRIPVDWRIVLRWSDKPDGMELGKSGAPVNQLPVVESSAPEKVDAWFREAVGSSVSAKALAAFEVKAADRSAGDFISLHFATPQTASPRSRQLRFSRRLTAALLEDLGMVKPFEGVIPPGLDPSKILCLYDAGGTGFGGSMNLERIVDDTNLDFTVMPVCGEDIRDGVLTNARGFIIPGGGARAIALAMKRDGVEKVRAFVEAGGSYIGVCAGAYFPTSGFKEYAAMSHLKHSAPWMKGRADLKVDLTPEGEKLLGSEFKSFTTRYNNGPVFPDLGPPPEGSPQRDVVPLALFKEAAVDSKKHKHDSMIDTPAILATTWGKGRILTISPHPEVHPELTLMVARCYGWALGVPKERIEVLK